MAVNNQSFAQEKLASPPGLFPSAPEYVKTVQFYSFLFKLHRSTPAHPGAFGKRMRRQSVMKSQERSYTQALRSVLRTRIPAECLVPCTLVSHPEGVGKKVAWPIKRSAFGKERKGNRIVGKMGRQLSPVVTPPHYKQTIN
jgi:hypothetical protein